MNVWIIWNRLFRLMLDRCLWSRLRTLETRYRIRIPITLIIARAETTTRFITRIRPITKIRIKTVRPVTINTPRINNNGITTGDIVRGIVRIDLTRIDVVRIQTARIYVVRNHVTRSVNSGIHVVRMRIRIHLTVVLLLCLIVTVILVV